MARIFLLLVVLLCGCSNSNSFETTILGYSIQFPKTASDLPLNKYSIRNGFIYTDSTNLSRIEWLFNPYESGKDTIYKLPDQRQAYGVNIYLRNRGNLLDSIKVTLEKQYNTSMKPLIIRETANEPHFGPAGYYCQLNSGAMLFLRKASCPQGDSWCHYNCLRIAIGYQLNKAEQERFAASFGKIWYSID